MNKRLRHKIAKRKQANHPASGYTANPLASVATIAPLVEVMDRAAAESCLVPFDENLLERSRSQWQFGDWESLAALDKDALQYHPDRAKLALLAAAGHLQSENKAEAKLLVRRALDWGCSKKLVSQILIAGVHNSLGRAAAVCGQEQRALNHFESSVATGTPGSDVQLLTNARVNQQYTELGLLAPKNNQLKHFTSFNQMISLIDPENVINQALSLLPQDPALLIAGAEVAMRQGRHDEAIRRWQQLASVEGGNMPKAYYDRLNQAYTEQKSFPLGLPEEEYLSGDGDKHELLRLIHTLLQPQAYLEIGVQTGKSLALASCPAIGVDPMPQIKVKLGTNVKLVNAASDDFFSNAAMGLITTPPELVFIDGMHLFEYVLRDFINVERYSSPHALVVIDDIYPGHPSQADRNRHTRAWTGDVWKMLSILQSYRPDLQCCTLDAYPTGLLLVSGLDARNTVLPNAYDEILKIYKSINTLPEGILLRSEAFSCKGEALESFINKLKIRKHEVTMPLDR